MCPGPEGHNLEAALLTLETLAPNFEGWASERFVKKEVATEVFETLNVVGMKRMRIRTQQLAWYGWRIGVFAILPGGAK